MAKRETEERPKPGPKMARLNAFVEDDLRICLYHALLDDRLSFTEWLKGQIHAYLAERQPRKGGRKT